MTARFCCPSSELALGRLTRAKVVILANLALAVLSHLLATQIRGPSDLTRTVRPLTTQFVKRQPRLTKPLELKKRPRPRRRALRREMLTIQARSAGKKRATLRQPDAVLRKLARPATSIGRVVPLRREAFEPSAVAQPIHGSKEARQTVEMSLEMMDVESLDTGRYRAIVVYNPTDRRSIRGFLHLALVIRSSQHAVGEYRLTANYIRHIVEAVNNMTEIRTDLAGYYSFDSRLILSVPWLFVASGGDPFELTGSEAANMGAYLTLGGFVFAEAAYTHPWEDIKTSGDDTPQRGELLSLKAMFKEALAAAGYEYGRDWDFEDLPDSHPIYHCYFDFQGPLVPADSGGFDAHAFVRGITLEGRLVAMIETGDYEQCIRAKPWNNVDGTRFKQFLVNTVVFALTQEGSVTQQTMDTVDF